MTTAAMSESDVPIQICETEDNDCDAGASLSTSKSSDDEAYQPTNPSPGPMPTMERSSTPFVLEVAPRNGRLGSRDPLFQGMCLYDGTMTSEQVQVYISSTTRFGAVSDQIRTQQGSSSWTIPSMFGLFSSHWPLLPDDFRKFLFTVRFNITSSPSSIAFSTVAYVQSFGALCFTLSINTPSLSTLTLTVFFSFFECYVRIVDCTSMLHNKGWEKTDCEPRTHLSFAQCLVLRIRSLIVILVAWNDAIPRCHEIFCVIFFALLLLAGILNSTRKISSGILDPNNCNCNRKWKELTCEQ